MVNTLVVYLCCLATGICMARVVGVNDLLGRVLLVLAGATVQLLVLVQLLSLCGRLNGTWLLGAGLAAAGGAVLLSRVVMPEATHLPWRTLTSRSWHCFLEQARQARLPLFLAVIAGAFAVTLVMLGTVVAPLGDTYHYEMPVFWIQHESMAPFASTNPRVVSLSFATEVLAYPGHFFLRGPSMVFGLTLLAGALNGWIAYWLARRLGCGFGAALIAAVVMPVYGPMAISFFGAFVDFLVTVLWAGACLVFLFLGSDGARPDGERLRYWSLSVLFFTLACGAKNVAVLAAPFVGIAFVLLAGRGLWRPKVLMVLAAVGLGGFTVSGTVWNYVSNQAHFGDFRGPPFIKQATSSDLHPVSVWTRTWRGAVQSLFDTQHVPSALAPVRARAAHAVLGAVGADRTLAEDKDFYSMNEAAFEPRLGLGLPGIFFYLPGMVAAVLACLPWGGRQAEQRSRILALVLIAAGAYVIGHALLRWQSIGLVRLVPWVFAAGAPLPALLLSRLWAQRIALVVVVTSAGLHGLYMMGMTVRRVSEVPATGLLKPFDSWRASHRRILTMRWRNEEPRDLPVYEFHFTKREVVEAFLEHLPGPTGLGVIGGPNLETVHFFGPGYCHKVVCLVDNRMPGQVLDPPAEVDYIVDVEGGGRDLWAKKLGFRRCFVVTDEAGERAMTAYVRER